MIPQLAQRIDPSSPLFGASKDSHAPHWKPPRAFALPLDAIIRNKPWEASGTNLISTCRQTASDFHFVRCDVEVLAWAKLGGYWDFENQMLKIGDKHMTHQESAPCELKCPSRCH